MSQEITLVVPEGAHHYAIGHGVRGYYPFRLRTNQQYPARDEGGPWVIRVPIEIYHHFIGRAGCYVYQGETDE
jgi:hypothetical protein